VCFAEDGAPVLPTPIRESEVVPEVAVFRYLGYVLIAVIAVALAAAIAVILVVGVADGVTGGSDVYLTVFDGVGAVGGHRPVLRAFIEGPGGDRPLGQYRLAIRFDDGWTGWMWIQKGGLAGQVRSADLSPGLHRYHVGTHELHRRLDVIGTGTVWVWPKQTPVLWVDAAAVVPATAGAGGADEPPPAWLADAVDVLKTLAVTARPVYLVSSDARGYAAVRRRLRGRGVPAGPAFWVIPDRPSSRFEGLRAIWPSVRGAVAASAETAQVIERLGVPVAQVPPAAEPGDPDALRRAWRSALERFTTPPTLGLADGG